MAWKIERWLSEVFPGEKEIYSEYRALPQRELAIVCAAVLDVALAELLWLRLRECAKESEGFLGLDGDGRAPAGSFGARIQLGLLVGLLTPDDAATLRAIKELRNLFAHRVKLTFLSPPALRVTTKLHSIWLRRSEALLQAGVLSGSTKQLAAIAKHLPTVEEAGEGLLLSVFVTYQAYFHRMHGQVVRIGDALSESGEDRPRPIH